MKAEKVIEHLKTQCDRLAKLEGEEVSGFVLIVPPEGDIINLLVMEQPTDAKSFFTRLSDRIRGNIEQQGYGGVGVPGMPRR